MLDILFPAPQYDVNFPQSATFAVWKDDKIRAQAQTGVKIFEASLNQDGIGPEPGEHTWAVKHYCTLELQRCGTARPSYANMEKRGIQVYCSKREYEERVRARDAEFYKSPYSSEF